MTVVAVAPPNPLNPHNPHNPHIPHNLPNPRNPHTTFIFQERQGGSEAAADGCRCCARSSLGHLLSLPCFHWSEKKDHEDDDDYEDG